MAAIVPVRTSPDPAVAIPAFPLRLMKTRRSGVPISERAPFRTINAPQIRGRLLEDRDPPSFRSRQPTSR